VAGRAALHSHKGREGQVAGQRRVRADQENVSDLLLQIPELQFVGAVPGLGEFGYDCGPSSLRLDREVGSRCVQNSSTLCANSEPTRWYSLACVSA
jgi:hypothetical protein